MTRADVNTDISTKITSKTAAGSLDNTEDGANRVLMMDYVDQLIPYKSYHALLNQTGSSATITLIANGLPSSVTFAVVATGNYTFSGSGLFTLGKTFFFRGVVESGVGKANFQFNSSTGGNGVNQVSLYVYNDSGALSDAVFVNMPIEIRVYN